MRSLISAAAFVAAIPLLAYGEDKPVEVKVGTLKAAAPAGWKSAKPNNRLRSYQFKLPGDEGGPGDAELAIYPESDPKAEKYFPRWKAQFVPPEGKTADDISKVGKIEGVAGAKIDVLDITGDWKYKERPFDPKSKEMLLDNQRVVWVIVADANEATHIRLSGPKETVDKHYPAFEKWLKGLK